ncbi:MAG: hypothetical protein HZC17_06375, partial [Candidatus Omnitrophica bacterium]|nr:hypothetical protein [Candidatus Omnitrophota bacterium]
QLNGNNAAAIDDYLSGNRLMNDFATYEIFWHWLWTVIHHQVTLTKGGQVKHGGRVVHDGEKVTKELFLELWKEREKTVEEYFKNTPDDGKFDRKISPLIMDILKRQLTHDRWITYGSRVLISVIERPEEERKVILDAIFSNSREEAIAKIAEAPESLRKLAINAHDFVYDIIPQTPAQPAAKAEAKSLGKNRIADYLTPASRTIFEGPRDQTLPLALEQLGRATEEAALRAFGIQLPTAFARETGLLASPAITETLPRAEVKVLRSVAGILPLAQATTPRALFVHSSETNASNFAELELLAKLDPKLKLTVWLAADEAAVNRLKRALRHVTVQAAPQNIGKSLNEFIAQSKIPTGFVAQKQVIASLKTHRAGLALAKVKSAKAEEINLTATLLAKYLLTLGFRDLDIKIHTGEELAGGSDIWTKLIADLAASKATQVAA